MTMYVLCNDLLRFLCKILALDMKCSMKFGIMDFDAFNIVEITVKFLYGNYESKVRICK